MRGLPIIISGPSGAGKTTLYQMAVERLEQTSVSVSYTTRPPRVGERDGVEYHFVDTEKFDAMAKAGEFLEHFTVHGNRYGTSRDELNRVLDRGTDVILEIDVQGAAEVRRRLDGGVYIFVLPPSIEACRARLHTRGKDDEAEIERRLRIALEEIVRAPQYDYIIVNDSIDDSFETLRAIIKAEKVKEVRMKEKIQSLFG
jgi:guanylate kinase